MTDDTALPSPADTLPAEKTITLRKPATIGGVEYPKLSLREPTAEEMETWEKLDGVTADIRAVATVSAVPESAIRRIGVRDLLEASRYLVAFTNEPVELPDPVPDTMELVLKKPVRHADETYDTLALREPSAAETAEWDKLEGVEADCTVIAAVTGVPKAAVRQLGARDLSTAATYLAHFLAPAPTAGAAS